MIEFQFQILNAKVQKLKNKLKNKDLYFAALTHEIRSPLNALLGSVDLLQNSIQSFQNEQLGILRTQQDSGQILYCLVNNILDASKIKNKNFEFVYENVDIRKVIYKLAQINKIQAIKKGVDIITEVNPVVPQFLMLDETRILQTLMNFVSNGIKFTQKGYVKIQVDWIRNKSTIPKEEQEKEPLIQFVNQQNSFYKNFNSCSERIQHQINPDHSNIMQAELFKDPTLRKKARSLSKLQQIRNSKECFSSKSITPKKVQYGIADFFKQQINQQKQMDNVYSYYTFERKGSLVIQIIDTGKGIENSENLFKPFQQESSQIQKQYGGTGLGL